MHDTLTLFALLRLDQPFNAGCALRNNVGVIIRKSNMTERSFTEALEKVLYNPKQVQTLPSNVLLRLDLY